ncbi:MAG: D-amino-acid transaminase [Pseudomonadota bacterium]|nr:D-amino-acid transaminase [Pseudomonadota bacterium]
MPRISYVNGRYIRHSQSRVHIEDRGYQFGDAVYEVIVVINRQMVDEDLHFSRLEHSLREIRMEMPFGIEIFRMKVAELLRLNRLRDANLYIQISRGEAPRNHAIPHDIIAAVVMTLRPLANSKREWVEEGVSIITVPDLRWKRPDIKSISLLPNILAKDRAIREGAYEAWQVDDRGAVTEGTSTNAWIVKGGKIITHPPEKAILNGVTRLAIIKIAEDIQIEVEERPFSVDEAKSADEAFLTSSTAFIVPIISIDGVKVGLGRPGPVSRLLRDSYAEHLWAADA